MKKIWSILKIVGIFVLLLFILIVGLTLYASIDKTDTFYLNGSGFSNYEYLEYLDKKLENKEDHQLLSEEMNVYVHRLSKAKGAVFAYRWYTNGSVTVIDDERFKKLTIWVASLPKTYPVELDFTNTKKVKAVYSHGGSAWPRAACSGYIKSGSLLLNNPGSSYSVRVKGILTPAGSRSHGDFCREQELNIEFSASEVEFSELTPWLGLKGEHPYAETYR